MRNIVISILLSLLTFTGAIGQRTVREYMMSADSSGNGNLPLIYVAQPQNNANVVVGSVVNVQINANDPNGTISLVRIIRNGVTLGWPRVAPYVASYTANTTSTDTISAEAWSNGTKIVSVPVIINVTNPTSFKILHFTKNSSSKPGVADSAQNFLANQGASLGFIVEQDSTGVSFNSLSKLEEYDIVIFNNTSGNNLLSSSQRANFENYINGGGAFIGIHSAADAYRHSDANGSNTGTWNWYAQMLGASVQNSPSNTAANYPGVMDHIGSHFTTQNLPDPWSKNDEYYYWENGYYDSTNVPVLQVRSTGSQSYDNNRAVSWYKYLPGGGRSFYTALGHSASDFSSDPNFQNHLRDAIIWSVTNQLPTISITSVNPQDTVLRDSLLTITATAADPDGTVDSVSFFVNGSRIGVDLTAPYTITPPTNVWGTFKLKAVAYDDALQSSSDSTNYTVMSARALGFSIDSIAAYFTYAYIADSAIDDAATDYVDTLVDISGNNDIPWDGSDVSLEFTTSTDTNALPNAYLNTDRVGNGYIRIHNALDVQWNKNFRDGNYNGPLTEYAVFWLNDEFTDYETVNGGRLAIRSRNTQDAIEIGGNNGGNFPNNTGLPEKNKLLIVEVVQDNNGDSKLWFNGKPHAGGATAASNRSYDGWLGYGTPSHIASHLMYFQGTILGELTPTERSKVYSWLYDIYDTSFVPWPYITNMSLEWDGTNNLWYMKGDTVLVDGAAIANIEYKWALQVSEPYWPQAFLANQLDRAKFIPGATNDTLFRNDFLDTDHFLTDYSPGNVISPTTPTNKRLTVFYRITDVNGVTSDWLQGPRKRDNQSISPVPNPVIDNPPTVSITNPTNGSKVVVSSALTGEVIATDDSRVDSVAFFINGSRIGVDLVPSGSGGAPVCSDFPGGRIALVHDGSRGDMDDHGALALSIGMIKWAGLLDSLVFIGHSNEYLSAVETTDLSGWDLPYVGANALSDWSEMQDTAGIGTFLRAGGDTSIVPVYNWTKDYNAAGQDIYAADATVALEAVMEASSASSPLWVSAAGPMDVIYRALQGVTPSKHQYIHLVSHSSAWNEKSKVDGLSYDWSDLKSQFPNVEYHDIWDQNSSNGLLDFRVEQNPATNWDWMLLPNGGSVLSDFIHKVNNDDHLNKRGKGEIDWSDAGQVYYIISGANPTGYQKGTPDGCMTCGTVELQALFDDQCGVGNTYTFTLPTNTPGIYTFKAIAYDDAQQTDFDQVTYTVGAVSVPTPPSSGANSLDSLATLFDYTYSADSVDYDPSLYSKNVGSGIKKIYDLSGNFDLQWTGGNASLRYKTDVDPHALRKCRYRY